MATDGLIEWVASRDGQKVAVEEMLTKGHPDGNLLFWRDVELLSRDPRGRVPELATRASELYPYITALPHSCP